MPGQQRRLQRPVGEWFVQQGLLGQREIDELVDQCRAHNRTVRWRAAGAAGATPGARRRK